MGLINQAPTEEAPMNQAPTRRKIIPKQRQIKSIHIIKKVGLMNQAPTEYAPIYKSAPAD